MEEPDERLLLIGNKIKKLIQEQGYSNREYFAHDHKINRITLGKVINGQNYQITTLLKILDALEVDIKEFFKDL